MSRNDAGKGVCVTESADQPSHEQPLPEAQSPPDEAIEKKPRLSRRQRILARILALVLATTVGMVAAEIVLRIWYKPPEYSWFPRYALTADPYTGARYAPNLRIRVSYQHPTKRFRFSTNSMGFRGPERSWKKPPGTFRVLFVGDSFTEGFGVHDNETFPHYFEQIARRMDPRVEVINAGQNACDIPEFVGLMRGYAERLAPDLVVLSLYGGNDVPIEGPPRPIPRYAMSYGIRCSREYSNRVRSFAKDHWILVRTTDSLVARLDRALHRSVLLYRLGTEQLLRYKFFRGLARSAGWIDVRPPLPPVIIGRQAAEAFLTDEPEDVAQKLRESLEDLREIKAICDRIGARLFVQIIPYPIALPRFGALWEVILTSSDAQEAWRERLGRRAGPEDVDVDHMNQRLREIVEQAAIDHVDLKPLFRQAARLDEFRQMTYKAPLGHFTPEENIFDALVLLDALTTRGLLLSSVSHEGIEKIWREHYAHVQPPFFPPPLHSVPGGYPVAEGFAGGTVKSSLPSIGGKAETFVEAGSFTPVLNVRPDAESAKRGDFIEYCLPLDNRFATGPLALAVEICQPAIDWPPRLGAEQPELNLDKAVRQSVRCGERELWSAILGPNDQGRWSPLILPLGPGDEPTTLSIRVEALKDFRWFKMGEFPLLLRLRRLRIYRLTDPTKPTT